MLRSVGHMVQARPGLGTAPRAGVLAATSAPKRKGGARGLRALVRVDRPVLSGMRSATTLALVTGPQLGIAKLADRAVGGSPVTAAQVARHRQVTIAANGAVILTGMLAQRAVAYSMPLSRRSVAAQSLGRQLAAGGVARALVAVTDIALGERGRQQLDRPGLALTAGGLITMAQSLAMRRANALVTLPPPPGQAQMPVLGVRGVTSITVPVSGRKLV